MTKPIVTDFEFDLQRDGTVLVEFCDDDGITLNSQVITHDAFKRIPLAAFFVLTAMDLGPEVAKKLLPIMRAAEEAEDGSDE